MNANEMTDISQWDRNLKIGDIIEARFTNSYNGYAFKAKVVKLNQSTLRVISMEPGRPYNNDTPNREFIINRFNAWSGKWSANNGAFPIKEPVVN